MSPSEIVIFFFNQGAAEVGAPTVKNYYTGGLANAKRLTRGLGWIILIMAILGT